MSGARLRNAFFGRKAFGSRILEMSTHSIGKICTRSSIVRGVPAGSFTSVNLRNLLSQNRGLVLPASVSSAALIAAADGVDLRAQDAENGVADISGRAYTNIQYLLRQASCAIRCLTEKNIIGNRLTSSYD